MRNSMSYLKSAMAIDATWQPLFERESRQLYFVAMERLLDVLIGQGASICPPKKDTFTAFRSTALNDIKVVVLGQDPYPTKGHGHGLSFSVEPDVLPLPKSLKNIYKELESDLGIVNTNGCLLPWSQQGVLLLNTTLTVEEGLAGSHAKIGWSRFTDAVIHEISEQNENVVFVLWGGHAQKKANLIDAQKHLTISDPHPSPLSAYRGFWGSKPFSRINDYLEKSGKRPINWAVSAV